MIRFSKKFYEFIDFRQALSYFLYTIMVTHHFGVAWHLPIILLIIIIAFVFVSAIIAIYAPAKRICNMSITETINEL